MATLNEVLKTCTFSHKALKRGYVSRKIDHGVPIPYRGKFGEGFTVLSPNFESTQFCFISYYFK